MSDGATRPTRRALVATWLTVAVALGLLLALAAATRSPLDDPDPARQRPGFLDAGDLPAPAPPVAPGAPPRGRPAVVFFLRERDLRELCRALGAAPLAREASIVVVVAGRPAACPAAAVVVGDPGAAQAKAYGVPRPRGGGAPVGYAVVDGAGAIRYRTLDPGMTGRLDEILTIVEALP